VRLTAHLACPNMTLGVSVTGSSAIQNLRDNPEGTLALAAMLLVVLLVIAGVGVACWVLWTEAPHPSALRKSETHHRPAAVARLAIRPAEVH
jgi:hypothetical protein